MVNDLFIFFVSQTKAHLQYYITFSKYESIENMFAISFSVSWVTADLLKNLSKFFFSQGSKCIPF